MHNLYISNVYSIMTEMQLSPERENAISYLITRIYSLSPSNRLTKKMILKILYKLKKSLPDDHPLKSHLQFTGIAMV